MKPGQPQASAPLSVTRLTRWALQAIEGIQGPFAIATGVSVLTIVMTQYNAQLIANFISQVSAAPGKAGAEGGGFSFVSLFLPGTPDWTAILFAITALLVIGLSFANRVGAVWLNTLMLSKLQLKLHDKLLAMGSAYHATHDMGENTAVVMQYSAGAQPMLRDILAFPFVRGVSLVTAIIFLFYNLRAMSGQEIIYPLLAVLLIVLPGGGVWLSGKLRSAFSLVRDKQGALSNALVDSLTSPQEVQLMNAGPQRSKAFDEKLNDLAKAQVQASMRNEISTQFQAAVPTLLQIGLIIWAVFGVGGAAAAAVVGIYLFVPRVVQPIQELVQFYSSINTAWPSIERVGIILEAPVEIADKGTKTAKDLKNFDVALDHVSFQPDPTRTVLDDVTIAFTPGKVTALVGRSGSGKTTILRMVSRLFDANKGKVTIGGVDIRELTLETARSLSVSVSQFPLYVEADVRANLRLGVPNATDAQMEEACKAADIWPALARLNPSDPLGTPVPRMAGKSGLAGGERRRLAIARALLSDSPILLLDEPSTGIDALSISKILEQITAKPGRTVLLVDHDMELVNAVADHICCIETGHITDIGTPDELLARDSLFKSLWDARKAYTEQPEMEIHGTVPVRAITGAAMQMRAGAVAGKGPTGVAPNGGPPQGGKPMGGQPPAGGPPGGKPPAGMAAARPPGA